MKYISVAETAKRWGVSERSVRGYCAEGKIDGAFLTGKTWNIPETAEKPDRMNKKTDTPKTLLEVLKAEKAAKLHGGIYHKIQIDLTYNSNHMEGSRLTHDQTRYIFETNTIGASDGTVKVDDVVETANHFKCIDMVIDNANYAPSEAFIKQLHAVLKNGTSDSRLDWFAVGNYKKLPNEVGGMDTTAPENVGAEMKKLLAECNAIESKTFDDLLDFHYRFERIHPFQDGNGRVGRLLLFKECLRSNIVPFIIEDDIKMFYYRGLKEWQNERGYLRDTCLSAQDRFQKYLDYFRVPYDKLAKPPLCDTEADCFFVINPCVYAVKNPACTSRRENFCSLLCSGVFLHPPAHMAATSGLRSWSCRRSAMRAMNSLFVGLPFVFDTV